MVQKKIKLAIITGPTAVGKSAAAVEAALRVDGEVVGADSMQIYRHMDIGTGKVTASEMCGIPHHMIDIVQPDEDYSVGRYVEEAKKVIEDIALRGKLPILVGGTGLYINSLLFNHSFASTPRDEKLRKQLNDFASINGEEALYLRLKSVDPESASEINIHDVKRVVRALEIYELTGKPRSAFKDEFRAEYDYIMFVLTDEREKLYERINERVDKMFAHGLVDEVKGLYKYKECNSMQAIGYKEVVAFLDGKTNLISAIEAVKQNSRRYAKRQFTFFKGMKTEKTFIEVGSDIGAEIKKFAERI